MKRKKKKKWEHNLCYDPARPLVIEEKEEKKKQWRRVSPIPTMSSSNFKRLCNNNRTRKEAARESQITRKKTVSQVCLLQGKRMPFLETCEKCKQTQRESASNRATCVLSRIVVVSRALDAISEAQVVNRASHQRRCKGPRMSFWWRESAKRNA